MKDEYDNRTLELPGLNATTAPCESGGFVDSGALKRGRGRPRKLDALTPAERAKRYRDSRRNGLIPERGLSGKTEPWQWLREAFDELCSEQTREAVGVYASFPNCRYLEHDSIENYVAVLRDKEAAGYQRYAYRVRP